MIIEGLYTFLAIEPWSEGGLLLDERWFIQVDPVEARRRFVKRQVLTGVAKDLREAEWRADENDGPSTTFDLMTCIFFFSPPTPRKSSTLDGLFVVGNMLEPARINKNRDNPSLYFRRETPCS